MSNRGRSIGLQFVAVISNLGILGIVAAVIPAGLVAQASVTWSADIRLKNLASLSQRLAAPEAEDRETLVLSNDAGDTRSVKTCLEYLDAKVNGFMVRTTYEVSLEYPFISDCYLLRDLKTVRVPVDNYLPVWGSGLINNLPPILESGEQYPDNHEPPPLTWSAAVADLVVRDTTADTLMAEDYRSTYDLQLLAVGDFNGDGVADMVVAGNVNAKGGTAKRRDYMVFTRCKSSSTMIRFSAETPPFNLGAARCP